MKKICRILSIVAVFAIVITASILTIKAVRKPKNKEIYATSVNFKTIAKAIEIYSENEIILSKEIVTIKPSDCTIEPEFLFKKYGESGETEIKGITHKFESEGKYILICRVKSGDAYYVEDRLTIDVVNVPRETTSFYIQKLNITELYVDENVDLNKIVYVKRSNNSSIDVVCDEYVKYDDEVVMPIKEGGSEIIVLLLDNDIAICQEISINVKPSIINAKVELKLTLGGVVLENNVVEKEYSQFNFNIGYELINIDRNQSINCWTDSNIVEVVKYNSPTITLRPLSKGIATVYVVPIERPDLIFEIIVSII